MTYTLRIYEGNAERPLDPWCLAEELTDEVEVLEDRFRDVVAEWPRVRADKPWSVQIVASPSDSVWPRTVAERSYVVDRHQHAPRRDA